MKRQGGFTLVELIVSVTIVTLIAGISIMMVLGGLSKRRDANRVTHVAAIQTTLEFYLTEHKNFDTILAADGVLKTQYGQTFREAVYYSTPVYPSALPGRHPWSTLDIYLSRYNSGLPLDPLNDYDAWTPAGEPDYSNWDIRIGYIIVRLRSMDVNQPGTCPGQSFRAAYVIESVQEKYNNKYVDPVREPRLFSCTNVDSPQRHVMKWWGILK